MKITGRFQWKTTHYLEHTLLGLLILAVPCHGAIFVICKL